jgi:hypothetical protein
MNVKVHFSTSTPLPTIVTTRHSLWRMQARYLITTCWFAPPKPRRAPSRQCNRSGATTSVVLLHRAVQTPWFRAHGPFEWDDTVLLERLQCVTVCCNERGNTSFGV